MLELGSEIVKGLGEAAGYDLLARWMAEYIGEKINQIRTAQGAQRDALESECADLILRLWKHRHTLPDGSRPLESFEILFKTLEALSSDNPWHPLLRELPSVDKQSETEKIITAAIALDKSASALIRYLLAQAVATIPKSDKKWSKLRAAKHRSPTDIKIVLKFIDDEETFADKEKQINNEMIAENEKMLSYLECFENNVSLIRNLLETELESMKNNKNNQP